MKNLSLILNGVLAVAVIYLYVLHFSNGSPSAANSGSDSLSVASSSVPKIAYVNSDTLLEYYTYFQDKRNELEETAKKLQANYESRARGLQSEIESFQRSAGSMTMNQARAVEEDLMKKQQNLVQYQQNLSTQLAQEEAKVNEELYAKVSEYLGEYGKTQDYKVVLTYTKNSGVLYADDSLDITRTVIDGLNTRYKEANVVQTSSPEQSTDTETKPNGN
ncbi:MAG: OmpH family outer membrane protein [Cyclobacteriaceae bacterium]